MDQKKLREMLATIQREALAHEGQALRLRQAYAVLAALQDKDDGVIKPMGEASDI